MLLQKGFLLLLVAAVVQCGSSRNAVITSAVDDSTNTFLADPAIFQTAGVKKIKA